MRLKSRIERLETRQQSAQQESLRIVVTGPFATDLTRAACYHTRCANGSLMEVVYLNGSRDGISDEDLERFIESFPIKAQGGSHSL
jgi:hypothetical protein